MGDTWNDLAQKLNRLNTITQQLRNANKNGSASHELKRLRYPLQKLYKSHFEYYQFNYLKITIIYNLFINIYMFTCYFI